MGTPSEIPMSTARSKPAASITARTSSMRSSSVGASATGSESPYPRRSNAITRAKFDMPWNIRAAGSCSHIISTWLMKPLTKTTSRSPSPNTWYARCTSPLFAYWVSGRTISISVPREQRVLARRVLQAERLGDQLVRAPPRLVAVRDGHDDDLVGAVGGRDLLEAGAHALGIADHAAPASAGRHPLAIEVAQGLLRRRHGDQAALPHQAEGHAAARREALGLLVGVRADRPHAHRHARRPGAAFPVQGRDLGAVAVDEVGERVGEAQLRGPHRALRRGPEQPDLRQLGPPGQHRREAAERVLGREVVVEVSEELG